MSKDKLELKGSSRFVMLINIRRVNPTSGISTCPGREHYWLVINFASCCATDQEGPEQEALWTFRFLVGASMYSKCGDVLTACYQPPARDHQPGQICHWSPNPGHQSIKINKDFQFQSSNLDVWIRCSFFQHCVSIELSCANDFSYSEPGILLRSWNSSPDFHTHRLPPSSALTKSAIHSWGRDPTFHAQYTWNNHGYTHYLITSLPGCQSTLKPGQWWPLYVPPGLQTGWYYCPYWECQTLKVHQMKHLQRTDTTKMRFFESAVWISPR